MGAPPPETKSWLRPCLRRIGPNFFPALILPQVKHQNTRLSPRSDDDERVHNNLSRKFELGTRLGVYVSLGMGQGLCVFIASLLMLWGMVAASSSLHAGLLRNLLRSPSAFFDVTPLGRIINRCGKVLTPLVSSTPSLAVLIFPGFFRVPRGLSGQLYI